MPFSQSSQISTIVGCVERLRPASVLDVGVGMGQYGFLLRNNLENIGLFEVNGRDARQAPRERWTVRIDGIEGFAGYLTPVHQWAYNDLRIGDALKLLPTIADGAYELVMAIDILEHFDTAEGITFLQHCRRIARRMALVSTPKDFIEQHVEANPFEDHRSVWTQADLAAQGYTTVLPNDESWVVAWQPAAA
ncbi:class I SAM-dependent methyltransferase [Aquabacterium sp.]|uniref:class I SAM-dependent methyltransferase n=1 Tax=Aquabacterium sp. TaxID=1872578 RepID=UPI002CBB28FB|nr:class I SAM-dependent methyltransferase [Aquabacterium sp.]HSW04563.1 class I SAM-dependent methyltransferase [Aquabacterium sp.]